MELENRSEAANLDTVDLVNESLAKLTDIEARDVKLNKSQELCKEIEDARKIIEEWWDTSKIKRLTWDLAEQLIAKYEWDVLDLSWLTSIDYEVAYHIAEFKWKTINLSWLKKVDDNTAFWLWDFQWEELILTWVTDLNERQARWLTNFKWQVIRLGELELVSMDEYAKKELAEFEWIIYTNGVELALASEPN